MRHENWLCPKCRNKDYETGEIRVTGGFWTKIFNIQNKIYSSVTSDLNFNNDKYNFMESSN